MRLGEPVGAGGNEDEADVVGRQAIGPAGDGVRPAPLGHPIAGERGVARLDERRPATIAALRRAMGQVGNDDSRQAGDGGGIRGRDNSAIDKASPQ